MSEQETPSGKNARKVRIVTTFNDVMDGYVYITYGQRLQDVLNDDRIFLPVHVIEPGETEFTVTQINKSSIYIIEEDGQIADRMVMFDPLRKNENDNRASVLKLREHVRKMDL